jgi:hypothetical protein
LPSISTGQYRSIHGARRCAGNPVDLQVLLLQQAIEHPPGECAMCTATLQGQVNGQGLLLVLFHKQLTL